MLILICPLPTRGLRPRHYFGGSFLSSRTSRTSRRRSCRSFLASRSSLRTSRVSLAMSFRSARNSAFDAPSFLSSRRSRTSVRRSRSSWRISRRISRRSERRSRPFGPAAATPQSVVMAANKNKLWKSIFLIFSVPPDFRIRYLAHYFELFRFASEEAGGDDPLNSTVPAESSVYFRGETPCQPLRRRCGTGGRSFCLDSGKQI